MQFARHFGHADAVENLLAARNAALCKVLLISMGAMQGSATMRTCQELDLSQPSMDTSGYLL